MAETDRNSTPNGAKALLGIVALMAIIAGVYAMVEPMGQRLEMVEKNADKHEILPGHAHAAADLAKITVQFAEVETQFDGTRDSILAERVHVNRRLALLEAWMIQHDREIAATDATQWEKIRQLERTVHHSRRDGS